MARQVQFRRGTTAEHSTFTGAVGEVTVDTDKDVTVVHDGATAGGIPMLKSGDDVSELTNDAGYTTNTGTVTSVGGAGTVNGISLSGTVTSSGDLTLGGTFFATVSEISDLTATAIELNTLDGITATTAELNKLDGFTGTSTDLNYAQALRATGVTTTEFDKLDGLTASTAELNKLDGATVTTAELNYNDIASLGTSQASKVVTADANGNVKLQEELQATAYIETAISVPSTTIDCDEANVFYKTISANTTFSFSYAGVNLTSNDAYSFTLILTVSGTRTVTWPASVDWAGGSAPDAPASGETDVFVFVTRNGGSTWYGFQAGDALS